ncbi:universal stress protein [Gordonia sp. CPCC 206044]|uniref:universal stress protein n=1 Tax=Gordonia sp. CPCC 206044 TaxID=3140793 RepID=UPI003AF3782A
MPVDTPIVAAVDGSEHALAAVRWAASAAAREKCPLLVMSAVSPLHPSFSLAAVSLEQSIVDADHAFAEAALDNAAAIAEETAPGVTVTRQVVVGKPSLALRELSSRARTVVVGRRGLGGVSGLLLGSVSTDITANADCPVVVVSGETPSRGPVVVGVDGSPVSTAAIAAAFEQASLLGTTITAVHAYGGFSSTAFFGEGEKVLREIHDGAVASLGSQLAGHRTDYPDVTVDAVVTAESPSEKLSALSADAQLIVLGSRGRGGFRGLMLGSTSQAVLHVATCPVMVVHSS